MLPSLDSPVLLHSSREDDCKLTPSQCAWRSRKFVYWYQADWDYGLSTIYFCTTTVLLFSIFHLLFKINNSGFAQYRESHSPTWLSKRSTAAIRYLTYRSYYIRALRWYSPPLGVILLGLVGVTFFFGMVTFGVLTLRDIMMVPQLALLLGAKPYYWPNTMDLIYGNSPPIATRAGWMSLAMLPFVIATAAKFNFITLLTGVSHEKLQVFHRWTSWAMFILALVHTFPFIIYHIKTGNMVAQYKTQLFYWTGIAALTPQAWLNFMSIGPIRNSSYEIFKSLHHLASLFFLVFLFIHCDFRLTSWDYFIVTFVLYVLSLLIAYSRTFFLNTGSHRAELQLIDSNMLKVTVPTKKMKWRPGQHVFVRFLALGVHAATSHPFTISSIYRNKRSKNLKCHHKTTDTDYSEESKEDENALRFYLRTKSGLTARLAALAKTNSSSSIPVLLEGPYGGLEGRPLETFDHVMIIVGGFGGSLMVPILEHLQQRLPYQGGVKTMVEVVWCVRDWGAIAWFEEDISRLASQNTDIKVSVYVTGDTPRRTKDSLAIQGLTEQEKETEVISASTPASVDSISLHSSGRPNLPALIKGNNSRNGSMAIIACGPASLLLDVRNTTAEVQLQILGGRFSLDEVFLHTEYFSW